MESRRILSKILAVICLIAIAMPSFSQVIATTVEAVGAAQGSTSKFGISLLNKDGWGYRIQERNVYKTYEIKGSTKDYSRDLYCLDFNKRFPAENGNANTYTNTGDLTNSITNKERIRLIAENVYVTSMTQEEKDEALSRIFANLIERTAGDANPVTLEFIKNTLNEGDIFFAQQCAIWKYTNNITWQGTSIWFTNKENPGNNDWSQISNIGQSRYELMKEVYDYCTGDSLVSESSITNPSLQKGDKISEETEDGYIVGPFHIKTGSNPNYTVDLQDQSGAKLTNYRLVDRNGNRLSTTLDKTLDRDFYVLIPLRTTVTKVILKLDYYNYRTTTSVWKNSEENSQPILEVEREKIPGNDQDEAVIQKPDKVYDLALRKYIVKVGNTEITNRTPRITYNKDDKEINYKHKKDPVVLKAGDTVVYDITVYNEGNQKATATRIKDILPEGLEFIRNSEINRRYGWIVSQDGSYIVSSYTKDYELAAFDENTHQLSSITVQVECRVKSNVTSGVLTNVAEIVEDNIDDIDSVPGSNNVQQAELPGYKGKGSNKDDLSDSDYFYRGQEDDDDFEKVTVEEIRLDLALRKYITTVNGENQGREPIVDVSPLRNGQTTAIYTHPKNPVPVKKGDIVIYSIRVYNEGDQNAYANEITDYIPEGLGFLVNHRVNSSNNWRVVEDPNNRTVKLNTISEAMSNVSLSDFQGVTSLSDVDVVEGKATIKTNKLQYSAGSTENLIEAFNNSKNEPSSKVVQVACVVLADNVTQDAIKNIAAITDERDENGEQKPDRDSQPEEINPSTYPQDSNIQDDDDFEKLILENDIYDLALRKYITKINDTDITDRVPNPVLASLQSDTTATYKHTKEPKDINVGDKVVYTIRVYNEGEQDAYVSKIVDHLPAQLKFLPDDEINRRYNWQANGQTVSTEYLAKGNSENSLIRAFNGTALDSKYVEIACEVVETENMPEKITNIAEIAKFTDANGNEVADRDSQVNNLNMPSESELPGYKDSEITKEYVPGQQDDDDFEKLIVIKKEYDLALRKYITKVNDTNITNRVPNSDVSTIATTKTATYNHTKSPKEINVGDKVVYTIRVYNEGEVDAYASKIVDHLPAQLKFLPNDEINRRYNWVADGQTVSTEYLAKGNSENSLIKAFDGTTLDSKYVEIACEVVKTENMPEKVTNIAEIAKITDVNEKEVTDRDSQVNNLNMPTESELPGYKDSEITKEYVPGQQDDDDFEKLVIIKKKYDLALKKFLTSVDGEEIRPSRLQKVNTTPLKEGKTDAEYTLDKSVYKVKTGSNVVYTIRVYNEGEADAYAEEVKDNIPEGLEFVTNSSINNTYKWKVQNGKVVTNFLSKEVNPDKVLKAFNKETGEISYQEVKIEFKVVTKETKVITNIAEIKADDGEDFDSTPDNDKPEEDDQDYDNIVPTVYDLALQKFITKVENKDIDSRVPLVSVDNNGKITYNHSHEPLTVVNKNVVTYTIRVYNEGNIAAYVEEVKDDIPEGLVFLPDNEINKKYGWKLYDENKNEVDSIEKAKYIRTDYLSKAKSAERGENNQLKPFDKTAGISNSNPDYRDVEVAFQVDQSKMPATSRTIKNIAEITNDDGDDIDSTPDNDDPNEDDIDDEEIQLKYFDLALLKYITKVVVNEDGVIKETVTGHDGSENPEPAAKVEINRKKLNRTTVTFIYTIKITNEGEIEGYAKEIKDRIPEGLEFHAEDNPKWKIESDGIVTTDALANTLLQPGESATVEIALRWKKSENNLGMKINTAEISKDENPYGTPDIDSTPDNNKEGEDDQDTAPVVLSIKTGSAPTYIVLVITIMTILSTGCYAIKRFVL